MTLETLVKHLQGKHPQSSHAGARGKRSVGIVTPDQIKPPIKGGEVFDSNNEFKTGDTIETRSGARFEVLKRTDQQTTYRELPDKNAFAGARPGRERKLLNRGFDHLLADFQEG